MGHGIHKVFQATIASGATTATFDLQRAYTRVYCDMTGCNAEVQFMAAKDASSTYRVILLPNINTSTVATNIWKIASAASGYLQDAPDGFRFMKVITTAAVANGTTVYLHCSD